jgi:hypothetical protein
MSVGPVSTNTLEYTQTGKYTSKQAFAMLHSESKALRAACSNATHNADKRRSKLAVAASRALDGESQALRGARNAAHCRLQRLGVCVWKLHLRYRLQENSAHISAIEWSASA